MNGPFTRGEIEEAEKRLGPATRGDSNAPHIFEFSAPDMGRTEILTSVAQYIERGQRMIVFVPDATDSRSLDDIKEELTNRSSDHPR